MEFVRKISSLASHVGSLKEKQKIKKDVISQFFEKTF
jgi:hypothetical protein